jgi:lipopolysaccharide/colanic/teichoic acid biosynthesis glycosyltransferase
MQVNGAAPPHRWRYRRYGTFRIVKFRTMHVLEDGNAIRQATRTDPRGWLRRTNIDELLQLFNLLKGDMSLVGPRPHAVAHN